jgi:tetratricopeptide (TPR) repeat protein
MSQFFPGQRWALRQRVFDNGQTVIHWRPLADTPARATVITFHHIGENDPEQAGFGEQFLADQGCDVVAVQKRAENWYQDLDIAAFRDAVIPLIAAQPRVFTYGASMGAYAALYFAEAVGALAIALSPRISIHPGYADLAPPAFARLAVLRHGTLAEAAGGASPRPHLVAYDPHDRLDARYFAAEVRPAFPGATYLRLPHFGHPVLQALYQMDRLKPLLLGMLAGKPVPDSRSLTRGVKDRSAVYLRNLVGACVPRGRDRTVVGLCDRAIALEPANVQQHWLRSTALSRLGRIAEAAAAAEATVALAPENAGLRAHLAWMLDRNAEPERALEAIEAALALDDRPARPHAHRSLLLERLGRIGAAVDAATAAAARGLGDADIQALLARLRNRVG